jgi:uncharacterized protein (DUF427 family)
MSVPWWPEVVIMATLMRQYLVESLGQLRYEPTAKIVSVHLGETMVARTDQAVLVWEPRRVVPAYAIPIAELQAPVEDIRPFDAGPPATGLLDPSSGFGKHTCAGSTAVVRAGEKSGAAFLPEDLDGFAVLDFEAFDWFEEDESIFGHPRDPFSRIDIRHSTRHIAVALEDQVLAESQHPLMLFETHLPPRYYLTRGDVAVDLVRSDTATTCAYKGHATHWSAPALGPDGIDIAWSYESPPPEMSQITGRLCFYQEKADFIVDGSFSGRPETPWSPSGKNGQAGFSESAYG